MLTRLSQKCTGPYGVIYVIRFPIGALLTATAALPLRNDSAQSLRLLWGIQGNKRMRCAAKLTKT